MYINNLSVPSSCRVIKYAKLKKSDQSTASNFQHALNSISDWALNNNMLINAAKTQIVHLSLSEPKYTIFDNERQATTKYVECQTSRGRYRYRIDKKLSFSKHVKGWRAECAEWESFNV